MPREQDPNPFERFPEMEPLTGPPMLMTQNLCGLHFYGQRDFDEETGSYVGTQFVVLFLIPILALGAYRVIPAAGEGWYFLGRVPLSRTVRRFNYTMGFVAVIAAVLLWILAYTRSAPYQAEKKLEEADRLVAAGQEGQAAELYLDLLLDYPSDAPTARQKLIDLIQTPPASAAQTLRILRVAARASRQGEQLLPDMFTHGLNVARRFQTDPLVVDMIEAVAPLAERRPEHLLPLKEFLENQVRVQPNNQKLASQLRAVNKTLNNPDE